MLASLWMVFPWGLPRAQKVDSEVIRMCNGGILTTTVQFANVGFVFLFSIASAPRSTRYSESWQKDTFKSAFRHPLACFRSHPDGLLKKYRVINSIQTYIYHCGMHAQGGKNRSWCLLPSLSVISLDVRMCNTWNDFYRCGLEPWSAGFSLVEQCTVEETHSKNKECLKWPPIVSYGTIHCNLLSWR